MGGPTTTKGDHAISEAGSHSGPKLVWPDIVLSSEISEPTSLLYLAPRACEGGIGNDIRPCETIRRSRGAHLIWPVGLLTSPNLSKEKNRRDERSTNSSLLKLVLKTSSRRGRRAQQLIRFELNLLTTVVGVFRMESSPSDEDHHQEPLEKHDLSLKIEMHRRR